MKVTIDASVWVASQVATDVNYGHAAAFIQSCSTRGDKIIVPEIVLMEVAAAIARLTQDSGTGQIAAKKIERFPGIRFRSLDSKFLERALILATRHFLRAFDALYLAVTREAKSKLITLDSEILQRGKAAASILTPQEYLVQFAMR